MSTEQIETIKALATIITPILSAGATVVAVIVGVRLGMGNTLRAIEAQNDKRTAEIESDRKHKEKEQLRLWFEGYAIEKCIDPLIEEIVFLKSVIVLNLAKGGPQPNATEGYGPRPVDACARLFVLTNVLHTPLLVEFGRLACSDKIKGIEPGELIPGLNSVLLQLIKLRRVVLRMDLQNKQAIRMVCLNEEVVAIAKLIDYHILLAFKFTGLKESKPSVTDEVKASLEQCGSELIIIS